MRNPCGASGTNAARVGAVALRFPRRHEGVDLAGSWSHVRPGSSRVTSDWLGVVTHFSPLASTRRHQIVSSFAPRKNALSRSERRHCLSLRERTPFRGAKGDTTRLSLRERTPFRGAKGDTVFRSAKERPFAERKATVSPFAPRKDALSRSERRHCLSLRERTPFRGAKGDLGPAGQCGRKYRLTARTCFDKRFLICNAQCLAWLAPTGFARVE